MTTVRSNVRGETQRRKISEIVQNEPGITLSSLTAQVKIAWATLSYHVQTLVAARQLVAFSCRGQRHLFPPTTPASQHERLAVFHDPVCGRLIGLLRTARQVNVPDAMEACGLGRHAAMNGLVRMERLGIIARRGNGHRRYALTAPEIRHPIDADTQRLAQLPAWAVERLGPVRTDARGVFPGSLETGPFHSSLATRVATAPMMVPSSGAKS